MTTLYVIRALGSTLVITLPSTLASVLVMANFHSGDVAITFRDGNATGESR